MKTHPRRLPDQSRREPDGGVDGYPGTADASTAGSERAHGAGLMMIDRWITARAAAELAAPDHWDGPLVSLALALTSGRHVDAQAAHFARSRQGLLNSEEIRRDLDLGLEALEATARQPIDVEAIRAAAHQGLDSVLQVG